MFEHIEVEKFLREMAATVKKDEAPFVKEETRVKALARKANEDAAEGRISHDTAAEYISTRIDPMLERWRRERLAVRETISRDGRTLAMRNRIESALTETRAQLERLEQLRVDFCNGLAQMGLSVQLPAQLATKPRTQAYEPTLSEAAS